MHIQLGFRLSIENLVMGLVDGAFVAAAFGGYLFGLGYGLAGALLLIIACCCVGLIYWLLHKQHQAIDVMMQHVEVGVVVSEEEEKGETNDA